MSFSFGPEKLPAIDLRHLQALTDETGMLQHSTYSVPNRKTGYTTDDNARALVAVLRFQRLHPTAQVEPLALKCLSFLHCMQLPSGLFHNLLSFDRRFLDSQGSWDCFGRSMWACAAALNSSLNENIKATAKQMIDEAMPNLPRLDEPRPLALAAIALHHYARAKPEQTDLQEKITSLSEKLLTLLKNKPSEWHWFENKLTYCNARMPQALFLAYQTTKEKRFLLAAEKTYAFLREKTFEGNTFVPVGQDGWFPRGGKKALFDQQTIEAGTATEAAIAAFNATGKQSYLEDAAIAFNWFLGKNILKEVLYDSTMAACFDGLTKEGANLNQGAESTLAYLIARTGIEETSRKLEAELAVEKEK